MCRDITWGRIMIEAVNKELSMLDPVVRAALRRNAFPKYLYLLDDELFYTTSMNEHAHNFALRWRDFIKKHKPSDEYLMSIR
jgi:hypothetical protein